MDWNDIQTILYVVGKFLSITYFFLLLVAVLTERKVSSIVISFIVLALSNGIMLAATPILYDISSNEGVMYKFVWYGGFAFADCVSLYLLYKLHKLLKQNVSQVASLVGCALVLYTFIQSIRFVDRYVMQTDLFTEVYRNAVPALNILLIPMLIFFWLRELRVRKTLYLGVNS